MLPVWFAIALICAALSFVVSRAKGLNVIRWTIVGLLLGPIGLVACAGMPDRQLRARFQLRAKDLESVNISLSKIQNVLLANSEQEKVLDPVAVDEVQLISRGVFTTGCPATEQDVWSGVQQALGGNFEAVDPVESDVSFYEAHLRGSDGCFIAWFRVKRRSGDRLEWHQEEGRPHHE